MAPADDGGRDPANRLRKLAKSRQYDELETAWLEAVEDPAVRPADLVRVLAVPARRGEAGRVESLLWYLLQAVEEREGAAAALAVAREAADLVPPEGMVPDEVALLYRKAHAGAANLEALVSFALRRGREPFAERVALLDRLLALEPGSIVEDVRTGRVGRVEGFDENAHVLVARFGEERTEITRGEIASLKPLPAEDFAARAVTDRASLESLARDDPEALVQSLLESRGPRLDYAQVRAALEPLLGGKTWGAWWRSVRPVLERSGRILLTDETRPTFILSRQATSYAERLRRRFDQAPPADKAAMVLEYLEHLDEERDTAGREFLAHASAVLAGLCADAQAGLPAAAALMGIQKHLPDLGIEPSPAAFDDALLPERIARLDAANLFRRVMEWLREARPRTWPHLCAQALPAADRAVCEAIARELLAAGHAEVLRSAMASVAGTFGGHPGALLWLWRAASKPRFARLLGDVDLAALARKILWSGGPRAARAAPATGRGVSGPSAGNDARLRTALRNAISTDDYALVRRALEGGPSAARQVLDASRHNPALTARDRSEIAARVREVCPEILAEDLEPWEEEVIYVTAEGFERRRAEFQHLVHERMLENSRAIVEAARKGDLSENAEYTAALEERDRLSEAARRMESEFARARIITRDLSEADRVTVGSTILARDLDTGREERFTFLGPWDMDAEKRIFSYRAPLGLAFMGRRAGETVEVRIADEVHRWRVLEVTWEAPTPP